MTKIPYSLKECRTYCNDGQVFPAMHYKIDIEGKSANKAATEVEKETDGAVTVNRATNVWRRRSGLPSGKPHKPTKKQTKPEVKKQLKETAKEILAGNIKDDDVKILDDAISQAIKEKTCAPRVATKTAAAVRKRLTENKKPRKEVSDFKKIKTAALHLAEGLQFWADGTIVPKTDDEGIWAAITLRAAPSIVMHYDRLGLNIEEMLNIAQGKEITHEDHREKRGSGNSKIIDITPN